METKLYIDLPKTHYAPGETVSGTILWALEKPPVSISLTLGWWTEGRGTRDARIEASEEWRNPNIAGEETFAFALPSSPYSFSGTLIALKWAIELSVQKGKQTALEPIVVSPLDLPIELPLLDEGGKQPFSFLRSR